MSTSGQSADRSARSRLLPAMGETRVASIAGPARMYKRAASSTLRAHAVNVPAAPDSRDRAEQTEPETPSATLRTLPDITWTVRHER
jgi:hypothetical protein